MTWRNFKTESERIKGLKVGKPPFLTLTTLNPPDEILKNSEPDPGDLHHLIGETLMEIDRRGRPWTGWRKSLTQKQRDRLKALESEIDLACLAGDRRRLTAALTAYKDEIN